MIQTHPLLYPGDNRHSSTLPTSFSPTHSIPPPPSSTNLARTSIYSRMVYPSSMPRFQGSQLWPNRCSYGVSLAPTVTAIPWTHTTQRLSTGEKTASRSQQETPETNFVLELSQLFKAFAEKTSLESVGLKAIMALSTFVLQKPFRPSKAKVHASCLTRRLVLWKDSNLNDLVLEGQAIQSRLPKYPPPMLTNSYPAHLPTGCLQAIQRPPYASSRIRPKVMS